MKAIKLLCTTTSLFLLFFLISCQYKDPNDDGIREYEGVIVTKTGIRESYFIENLGELSDSESLMTEPANIYITNKADIEPVGEVFVTDKKGYFRISFDRSRYSEERLDVVVSMNHKIVFRKQSSFKSRSLPRDWKIVLSADLLQNK
jgi:hypothetical protein